MDKMKSNLKRESPITTFLWWCSGAEIEILRQVSSAESMKFITIGMTILMTALFAALSGSYAFIEVFKSLTIGVIFGLMWGGMVFILERFTATLVSKAYSTYKTLIRSIPSIAITVFISIVISTPLSLKILEQEIRTEKLKQIRNELIQQKENISIKISNIKNENNEWEQLITNRLNDYKTELKENSTLIEYKYNYLIEYKRKRFEDAKISYMTFKEKNDSVFFKLNKQVELLNEKINSKELSPSIQLTFSDMLQLLSDLKKENLTINLLSIFLFFFFIIISSSPILIQIFSNVNFYNEYIRIRDEVLMIKPEFSEQSNENKVDDLKYKVEELKKKFDNFNPDEINKMINEIGEQKRTNPKNNSFETYFYKILDSLYNEGQKNEKQAKDFFKYGMLISISGIVLAFCLIAFWLNYFSIRRFEIYHLFEIVSGSIVFIVIEFLGAWFLKQNRTITEKNIQILKIKTILDRYLLSYLAINEFVPMDKKENFIIQLLSILEKDIRFPPDLSNKLDTSFAQETFSSLTNLTESVKNLTKGK